MSVEDRILDLLSVVVHRRLDHPRVSTSQDASDVRQTPLEIGGKSLLMRLDDPTDFRMFVVSASRRTDAKAIRAFLGARRLRFATPDELLNVTGLTPGCVPPFGRPIFDVPLYVDESIVQNRQIAFSAGDHEVSIIMDTRDYLTVAKPDAVFRFSGCT